jgi:hypothetical protein
MLRRYLSLAFPVMLSAAAALLYLHFRQAAAAAAPPADVRVAQAPTDDPFAPPPKTKPEVKPATPKPPETKPATPANERRLAPRLQRKPTRETPKNDDEVKSPFLKNLLAQLGGMTEGTDEDKASIRQMIYDADVELSDSLGPNARSRIEAASNLRAKGFVIGAEGPRTATGPLIKRKEVGPNGEILKPAKPMKKPDPFQDDKPTPPAEEKMSEGKAP